MLCLRIGNGIGAEPLQNVFSFCFTGCIFELLKIPGYAANITSRTYIDVDPNSGYRVCVRQTNGQKQVGCGCKSFIMLVPLNITLVLVPSMEGSLGLI